MTYSSIYVALGNRVNWATGFGRLTLELSGSGGWGDESCTCIGAGRLARRPFQRRQPLSAAATGSVLLVVLQSYDYISLFMSFFDISVSLSSLFQRKAFVYECFYLPRLNKLFDGK